MLGLTEAPPALGQEPAAKAPPKGGFNRPPDPRVQQRKYRFQDTNEDLPYALFVSSKVSAGKKNPLIVALHGLGGDGNALLRGNALDLAEEGGYILVGPMGYNPQGWYGSPVIGAGRGGKGKAPAAPVPPNLTELSEKDVLNVLDMVRKEFNVDERRTYLMGHSMGGAGALHMGTKHASTWAAVASMAPAAFVMQPSILESVKDAMPLILIHGDADTVVPVDVSRRWNQTATSLKMAQYKYLELPGADHGTVITQGVPEIFQFFKEHTK
jgi:predicted peptidase